MKTTQAWGWLAAGVLALGLNGFYHDGGAAWLHRNVDGVVARIVKQSEAVMALATGRADRFVTNASLVAAGNDTASCRLAPAMARVQTKIARTQNGMAHFQAISAKQEVEAQRARIEAQIARVRLAPVAFDTITIPVVSCPRVRVDVPRVNVPGLPMVRIPAPVVHVEVLGSGPV